MMQIVGNPVSCWELTAHASRTIVALGYHNITDTEPATDLDREIHAAVAWCSQFDSCMSLLLLRPRSLPPLQVKVSSLLKPDPANPMSIFEIMAMEMIPVHDKILELTLEPNGKRSATALNEEVVWLRTEMTNLHIVLEKVYVMTTCIWLHPGTDGIRNAQPFSSTPIWISSYIGNVLSSSTFLH